MSNVTLAVVSVGRPAVHLSGFPYTLRLYRVTFDIFMFVCRAFGWREEMVVDTRHCLQL